MKQRTMLIAEIIIFLLIFSGLPVSASTLFEEDFDDGNFTYNPTWTDYHATIAPGTTTIIDSAARFYRTGAGGSGSSESLRIDTDINIDNNTTVSFDAKAVYRSVRSGCGDSCTEHPVNIQLYLEDNLGNEYRARYAVNYDGAVEDVTIDNFKQIAFSAQQNTWQRGLSYKISDLWPTATKITSIWIFGAGWDFDGYIDNIKITDGTTSQPTPQVFTLCVGVDYSDEDFSIITGESLGQWGDGPDGKRWAQLMYDKIKRTTTNWSPKNLSGPVILPEKEDPSHTNLDLLSEALTNIQDNIAPGDTFIFYFLGHGDTASQFQLDEYGGETTISPGDEYLVLEGSASTLSGFRDDYFTKILEKTEWHDVNKVVMFDACHSGGFMGNESTDFGDLEKISKIRFVPSAGEDTVGWYEKNSGEPVASYVWYMLLKEILGIERQDSLLGLLENSSFTNRFLGLLVSGLAPYDVEKSFELLDFQPIVKQSDDYVANVITKSSILLNLIPSIIGAKKSKP